MKELGQVYYRTSSDPDLLQQVEILQPPFSNPPRNLFIATWSYTEKVCIKVEEELTL